MNLIYITYLLKGAATSTLHLLVAVHEQHRLGVVLKDSSLPPTIPAGKVRAHVHQYRWTRKKCFYFVHLKVLDHSKVVKSSISNYQSANLYRATVYCTPLLADANPNGKVDLIGSKLIKESGNILH
jgi:hypothetical protein